jgi:hypothetical protein
VGGWGKEVREVGVDARIYERKIKTHPIFSHIRYREYHVTDRNGGADYEAMLERRGIQGAKRN